MNASPWARRVARAAYLRANYYCLADRGFRLELHPLAKIEPPAAWARVQSDPVGVFFGYYDKTPWSQDMNAAVFHRLRRDHLVDIVVYDRGHAILQHVGTSATWNYQQGCMTQWLRNGDSHIIFNDLSDGRLVARIVSPATGLVSVIPWPVQAVHPADTEALSINYRRLYRLRPEYGYGCEALNFAVDGTLQEDGIWRVKLESQDATLIVSLATLADNAPRAEMRDSEHKVNHLVYSPSGARFAFLHRWIGPRGKSSRLYSCNADGSDLRLHMDCTVVSHYSWRDDRHLLVWGRTAEAGDHYYLLDIVTGETQILGEGVLDRYGDGHPSYSPKGRWIVTDTYPDRYRQRHLLLFDTVANTIVNVGRFFAPWSFDGNGRCDLHPRWSPDGSMLSIDSAHTGYRSTYFVDVSSIVETETEPRV